MKKDIIWISIIFMLLFSVSSAQNQRIGHKFFIMPPINHNHFLLIDYSKVPDDNIHKFVWAKKPFHDINYEPSDLVPLQWRSHISAQAKHTLRKEAANNLEDMADAFYKQFWTDITIASAYRSYSYQKNSISENCKQSWRCAREWESEHQLWLAVDLWEASSKEKFLSKYKKYYNWLHDNAHLYWFHQSYQNWREIDWYYVEPWHRRYLGIDLSTKLREKDITFTQYINQ